VPGISEPLEASAFTVTIPIAPTLHWARPASFTDAIVGSETSQLLTESGVTGDGAALKKPVAVNETYPLPESCPVASAGARVIVCRRRSILLMLMLLQPAICRIKNTTGKGSARMHISSSRECDARHFGKSCNWIESFYSSSRPPSITNTWPVM